MDNCDVLSFVIIFCIKFPYQTGFAKRNHFICLAKFGFERSFGNEDTADHADDVGDVCGVGAVDLEGGIAVGVDENDVARGGADVKADVDDVAVRETTEVHRAAHDCHFNLAYLGYDTRVNVLFFIVFMCCFCCFLQ